ncbi:MAG: hypothetical protein WCP65_00050 [Bacteroidota bacterium]
MRKKPVELVDLLPEMINVDDTTDPGLEPFKIPNMDIPNKVPKIESYMPIIPDNMAQGYQEFKTRNPMVNIDDLGIMTPDDATPADLLPDYENVDDLQGFNT